MKVLERNERVGKTCTVPRLAVAVAPDMLTKHHLPDILLLHEPLAIRYVIGYLATTVPGFTRIYIWSI
jgi:hypothetical protein